MTRSAAQPDLFLPRQADLLDGLPEPAREPRTYEPSPAWVRAYLRKVMDEARGADAMPWDARTARFYRKVVPQMVNWLPAEEAARVRRDFEAELARLEAA